MCILSNTLHEVVIKLKKLFTIILFIVITGFITWASSEATTYYMDSSSGSDLNSGLSVESAWQSISKVNQFPLTPGDTILFKRGETWREQLIPQSGSPEGYIIYGAYSTGNKPLLLGSVNKSNEQDWTYQGDNIWYASEFKFDVGNLIFNNEESVGIKVRNEEELDQQGEFWYDAGNLVIKLYSGTNPAVYYSNIECALKKHIIDEYNKSYVIYENLDLRYGGAHGIGGGDVHHIIVRECDLSYIGGSRQHGEVRYGNGIEFWNSAHDTIVERCRLSEIYDAALTTQGLGEGNKKDNQYFRNNIVWNSEYCFEYWNQPETSTTNNIYFENNTCVNAGYGWGHNQRWKETDAGWHNGRHLAFYKNTAKTNNVYVLNNILYEGRNSLFVILDDWNGIENLVSDYNLWYTSSGVMIYYGCNSSTCTGEYFMNEFSQYREDTGKDDHSLAAAPLLVDLANNDFHPVTGSPACTMSQDGSYVGALPCVQVNVPPSLPELLLPPEGWISPETTIEFRWEKSSDSDNDEIAYGLYICENEDLTSFCISRENITHVENNALFLAEYGIVLLLTSMVFMGGIRDRQQFILIFALIVLIALGILSCGSSEENAESNITSVSNKDMYQTVSDLQKGTEYFWRVIAYDGEGGKTASQTRSFSIL